MDKDLGNVQTPDVPLKGTSGAAPRGTITRRSGKLYVAYATTEDARPVRHVLWWVVARVYHDPYSNRAPLDGDEVEYRGGGVWHAISLESGGAVKAAADATAAAIIEQVDVLPPAIRGKDLRWRHGQWEQRLATGWVAAGEGLGKRKACAHG